MSFPLPPFDDAAAPVTTYLPSGLRIALVVGYNVVRPECIASGFLNERKSHTVFDRQTSPRARVIRRTLHGIIPSSCKHRTAINAKHN